MFNFLKNAQPNRSQFPGTQSSTYQQNQNQHYHPQQQQQYQQQYQQQNVQSAPPHQQIIPFDQRPLPEGWISQYDPNSNRYYYVHTPSKTTTWDHPLGQLPVSPPTRGKRKALFVGINYFGSSNALRGCIADVKNIHNWLVNTYHFTEICILTDDARDPRLMPTRANIIAGMHWLVDSTQPGDSLFFHFSGHGSRVKDRDGDEADGYDETIVPVDFEKSGHIVDDEINRIMVQSLPPGSRLTAIFDCCHSGSAMDLPYTYSIDGSLKVKETINTKELLTAGMNVGLALMTKNPMKVISSGKQLFGMLSTTNNKQAAEKTQREKGSMAHVIMFSGCMDSQTSADATIAGQATGAMSWAFIKVMTSARQITLTQLLGELRGVLYGKYQQTPQMSTSHQWDVNRDFFTI